MKKIICMLIAFILIFTLFGCRDADKAPTDKKEETVYIEVPYEANNIVYLPEADENTVKITIEFPEEFVDMAYTAPNVVSHEEFSWGEYVPFVMYDVVHTNGSTLYDYAFLTDCVKNVEEGHELYDKLNDMYKTSYPVIDGAYIAWDISSESPSFLSKILFESQITDVSEDLSRIGTQCYRYEDTVPPEKEFQNALFSAEYRVYEEGTVTIHKSETDEFRSLTPQYRYYSDVFWHGTKKYRAPFGSNNVLNQHYSVSNRYGDKCYIYSLDTEKMIYEVEIVGMPPYEYPDPGYVSCDFTDFVSGRYLVMDFSKRIDDLGNFLCGTYIYDVKTEKLTFAKKSYVAGENVSYPSKLSPDGKYIVYTDCYDAESGEIYASTFYIKNLTDDKVIYYSYAGENMLVFPEIKCFVQKSALLKKIDN